MPKYIDIHCHVNFKVFDEDRDAVIRRVLDNDTWLMNVGTQIDTSKKAIELAHKYPEGVYAIIGLHPIHTDKSFHDEQELGEGGKEFTHCCHYIRARKCDLLLLDLYVLVILYG